MAREMVQQLKALVVLPKELGSIPRIHMAAHTLFWPPPALRPAHGIQINMQAKQPRV